jgi:hypothetical protein
VDCILAATHLKRWRRETPLFTCAFLLGQFIAAAVCAANPFLDAPDDKPISANFRGAEWSDKISQDEIALTARVITRRSFGKKASALPNIRWATARWLTAFG